VGWRDRDYGKFTDEEWKRFLGSGSTSSGRPACRGAMPALESRPASTSYWNQNISARFAAVLISLVASIGLWSHRAELRPSSPPEPPALSIRWSATDLAVAPRPGRICVTSGTNGRVCATYGAGDRPADALRRRLALLGVAVQS
jgi:hypothetical protein